MAVREKEQPLDYPYIIFEQIRRIGSNKENYVDEVAHLDDLLCPYWLNDEEYQKDIDLIDKEYQEMVRDIPKIATDEISKMKLVRANRERARKVFRALTKLLQRAGLMPAKTVEGVITDFPPDVKEEIMKLREEERKKMVGVPHDSDQTPL